MILFASGAGRYGPTAVGGYSFKRMAQPPVGNSKLMAANNYQALGALARTQTQKFISNGQQISRGVKGVSRIISVKA